MTRPYPAEALPEERLRDLRLFASDIDDTLTERGKIPAEVVDALGRLRAGGVAVWLVTGRCAAWGQALSRYLPVDGVIAENGGVACRDEHVRIFADTSLIGPRRERLHAVFEKIRRRVPQVVETEDNLGRLTDWAFERPVLSAEELARASAVAAEDGFRCIASSIHVHLFAGEHDKATTLGAIADELGLANREQALTLGDSANDEPLFDPAWFPLSAGVANVADYLPRLTHKPLYILPRAHAEGALWLLRKILVCRGL
jgi:HAD superfamily hydrolase (TIGR01484 family)